MIRGLTEYIPGPDMGTNEACMAWISDEIGRAVGLPRVLGGIPLDEIGATGYGLAMAAEVAAAEAKLALDGARVAIEGFGSVGQHAARFLARRGARFVAASDSRGAIHDARGIDVDALIAHKRAGLALTAFPVRARWRARTWSESSVTSGFRRRDPTHSPRPTPAACARN